jgi:hypothetical protein
MAAKRERKVNKEGESDLSRFIATLLIPLDYA